MYHTGGANARSVRSIMQFMMSPLTLPGTFDQEEATFADIQQYLLGLEAPKYPFPIDGPLAARGEKLFTQTCVRCHGSYGPEGQYPNKIVPLKEIGTDPARFHGITERFVEYYNRSWFAKEQSGWLADGFTSRRTDGYQAPPLDGVWATAPYFHNGSVPTLTDVLTSRQRPRIFTRSYRTGEADYDRVKVGWRVQVLDRPADPKLPPTERRKVYDTSQPGRGHGGHTYGDHFNDEERRAVIEYLKTL
jgi:mono/diheme cytochrome c family protein